MESPLISVIVPCYNIEQYLPVCIGSVIADKTADIELILVDDGSPDSSGRICEEFAEKDQRIRVIHQENGGVSVARNAGLDIAKGEWIWFVDGDDSVILGAFDILKEITLSTKCDTVFFGVFDQHGKEMKKSNSNPATSVGCDKNVFLLNYFCYLNQTMLFSREVIERYKIRFSLGVRMAEDLEFQYKYLIHCLNPVSISDALYVYNYREGSAMNNPNTDTHNVEDCLSVCGNLYEYIYNKGLPEMEWLSVRIKNLFKSAIQSAERLSSVNVIDIQNRLKNILRKYREIGYKSVADNTLRLAVFNLRLYFFALRIFYFIKND